METMGLGAGSYPMAPEKDEIEITISLEIKTTDIFPETWEITEIKEYITSNVEEYINRGDIEVMDIEV